MKKILLASSAIAMAAYAGAASAAEPVAVKVGGYGYFGLGFKDVDRVGTEQNTSGLGIMRDGEIHFNVRGTSDNGLTFSGRVELEAWSQGGDMIDENWFQVSGSWGALKVGGDDHASYNLATGVFYLPGAHIGHYDDFGYSNPLGFYLTNNRFSDTLGIFYNTPNISGFQAQVSYHPRAGADGASDTNGLLTNDWALPISTDIFSIGLNYGGTWDEFSFRISGGYDLVGSAPAGVDDDGFMVGAQVGFSGFGLGVHYKEGLETFGNAAENEYLINVNYATGPWYFQLGYLYGDTVAGVAGVDLQKIAGGVRYNLAPGVTTTLGLEYTDVDTNAGSFSGFAGMVYMGLSF